MDFSVQDIFFQSTILHIQYSKYYIIMTQCMSVYIINGREVKEVQPFCQNKQQFDSFY